MYIMIKSHSTHVAWQRQTTCLLIHQSLFINPAGYCGTINVVSFLLVRSCSFVPARLFLLIRSCSFVTPADYRYTEQTRFCLFVSAHSCSFVEPADYRYTEQNSFLLVRFCSFIDPAFYYCTELNWTLLAGYFTSV